jgi:hypothetical protein
VGSTRRLTLDTKQNERDTEEFWRTKVSESEQFKGPDTKFCRLHDLNNTTFKYWKYRLKKESFRDKRALKGPMGKDLKLSAISKFVGVEVKQAEIPRQLPDPRWVAELIFHLQGGL